MVKEKEEVKKVKKRFKFKKFLIVLFVLYLFGLFLYKTISSPIKTIFIENNKYLTDQEVIDMSGLRDYPSFLLTAKHTIKSKMLKNKLINEVKINKKLFGKIYINVTENTPLFYYKVNNKVILQNETEIDNNDFILPILVNNVDSELLTRLIEKYIDVNPEIRLMISEIKYIPNDIDKERFILTMNDGNYVYVTLYKISLINDYIKILSNLENKKGILYLDSGNYFEIFE